MLAAADAALNLLPAIQGRHGPPDMSDDLLRRLAHPHRLAEEEQDAVTAGTLAMAVSDFTAGALEQSQMFASNELPVKPPNKQRPLSSVLAGQDPQAEPEDMQQRLATAMAPLAARLHLSACRLVHWLAGLDEGHRQRLLPYMGGHSRVLELLVGSCDLVQRSSSAMVQRTEALQRCACLPLRLQGCL